MGHPLRFALPLLLVWTASCPATEAVDYTTQIKPLLSEKCYACHGVLKQEADLRLETRGLMLDHGVLVPGQPADSELLARVTSTDGDRMPPPHEGSALTADQIQLLKQWIAAGAPAPEEAPPEAPEKHWAFQPIVPPLPTDGDSTVHPVDALLQRQRDAKGLQPVDTAPRPLLIRRLYLDLIGLPPTAEQLRDERPWTEIVDDLLADPAHGERWARHWMDVWRYSDWYGLGSQIRYSQKHIWHWRDWIVRSLCDDKGYDRMIREMIAGDELAPEDPEAVAGTGFLARNYYLFNRTTWLDSTIEHTGKAFLGLTLNCAKCHDHKYDPISQLDYYRFRVILEPHQVRLDPVPGETDFEKDGLPRAFDDSIDRPTYLHRRGDPKNPDESRVIEPGVPAILDDFAPAVQPVSLPPSAYAPGTRDYVRNDRLASAAAEVDAARTALRGAESKLAAAKAESPQPQAESAQQSETAFSLVDDFDRADETRWQLIGDGWEFIDGALHQTQPTREEHMVRLIPKLPRDFELICDYVTTGGTMYKSVTFRFDQSADSSASNFVYTSAHAPGPKVHVAYKRDGKTVYPSEGRVARPIEIGKPYRLRVAVRDTLVNVWLDDEFIIAYRLPGRMDGFLSLSGFDATVAFDRIELRSLPETMQLKPAANGSATGTADPETAVTLAERKLAAAEARLASLRATIAADRARFVEQSSEDVIERLMLHAARGELQAKIAAARHAVVRDAADETKVAAARKDIALAEKALAELTPETASYRSLRGSRKALETPAHKETDYPAVYPSESTGRRLALARWMTSSENPLTARVAVNHVWMRHFGRPLVESVFDFGLRAPRPEQAELLDFLAAEFMDSGWSFKHLHRLIVTSQAYRLSSWADGPENPSIDPENRYYWRANRRRMESQVVRDSLLHLAGRLDATVGGPSVEANEKAVRRSLYMKHSRDQQNKFLSMFDDADILQCYRRSESIVPQQALALSNSKVSLEMAGRIAERIAGGLNKPSRDAFLQEAFFVLLGRSATAEEVAACETFIEQLTSLPKYQSMSSGKRESAVRGRLVHALLNHNDFVTIR